MFLICRKVLHLYGLTSSFHLIAIFSNYMLTLYASTRIFMTNRAILIKQILLLLLVLALSSQDHPLPLQQSSHLQSQENIMAGIIHTTNLSPQIGRAHV